MSENEEITARLVNIYRYPVKGLSPESLQTVELRQGMTLKNDRAFAIENGKGKFDPDNPRYLPKVNFLMLMRNEKLARLNTTFRDDCNELTITLDGKTVARGRLNNREECRAIEDFMTDYMAGELKGAPRIVHCPGHSFSDVAAKCVHIINLASLRELERMMGMTIDPLRFRANLVIDGLAPFHELDLVDDSLESGDVRLKIFKRTTRCPATNVDPQKGIRDRTIPDFLFENFGHRDFGIYAMVERGGRLDVGAQFTLCRKEEG